MLDNTIEIPKEPTFDLPEGRFKARLVAVSPKQRFTADTIIQQTRMLFEVEVPTIRFKQPMAGRNFDKTLRRGSELRGFLEAWKGTEWIEQQGARINLDQLIGEEVELELTHLQRPPHKKPMVLISAIKPILRPLSTITNEIEDTAY
jgi:hypothetical protein